MKCCRARLSPEFHVGGYNLFQQEILDPASELYQFDPDVVILAIRLQELNPRFYESFTELTKGEIEDEIDSVAKQLALLASTFRSHSRAAIVIHNFEVPARPALGIMDSQLSIGQKNSILRVNSALEDIARQNSGLYILDYDGLTALHGKSMWQDD